MPTTSPDLDAAHAALNADDVLFGVSVHLPDAIADTLLTARGWTVETIYRRHSADESVCFIKPGGTLRRHGGRFGADFLWHRDEALALALTAEALA